MKKFTMELVWHNCLEYPPEESENDFLIVTDGIDVYKSYWFKKNGFYIYDYQGWYSLDEDQNKWWWADIRQTVQGEHRFKG